MCAALVCGAFFELSEMHKSYKRKHPNRIAAIALTVPWTLLVASGFVARVDAAEANATSESVSASGSIAAIAAGDRYTLQPGDVLSISVWKEPDLQAELLVRPDGGLSFPLAGDLQAQGQSVEQLQLQLTEKLKKFIPDPVVTVSVKLIGGNRIYVIGKVNRPGEYPLYRPIDVMQALSLAGGTTPFAAVNDIEILRRDGGKQHAIGFRYGDIEKGKSLEQNMLLQSGDTVVVP
jgi:polysaccharide export outer membrane protein